MSAPYQTNQIVRSAWRGYLQDGLTDLYMGAAMLLMGVTVREGRLIFFIAFLVIFGKRLMEWLKARLVTPRSGYARFPEDKTTGPLMLALVLTAVLFVFSVLAARGSLGDIHLWYQGLTMIPALMLSGGFVLLGFKSGLARYYLYALGMLAAGTYIATLPLPGRMENISLFLMSAGVLPVLLGAAVLARFLLRNPVLPEEARLDE